MMISELWKTLELVTIKMSCVWGLFKKTCQGKQYGPPLTLPKFCFTGINSRIQTFQVPCDWHIIIFRCNYKQFRNLVHHWKTKSSWNKSILLIIKICRIFSKLLRKKTVRNRISEFTHCAFALFPGRWPTDSFSGASPWPGTKMLPSTEGSAKHQLPPEMTAWLQEMTEIVSCPWVLRKAGASQSYKYQWEWKYTKNN